MDSCGYTLHSEYRLEQLTESLTLSRRVLYGIWRGLNSQPFILIISSRVLYGIWRGLNSQLASKTSCQVPRVKTPILKNEYNDLTNYKTLPNIKYILTCPHQNFAESRVSCWQRFFFDSPNARVCQCKR